MHPHYLSRSANLNPSCACHVIVISDNAVGSVIKTGSESSGRTCHLDWSSKLDDRQATFKAPKGSCQFRVQTVRFRDKYMFSRSKPKAITEPALHHSSKNLAWEQEHNILVSNWSDPYRSGRSSWAIPINPWNRIANGRVTARLSEKWSIYRLVDPLLLHMGDDIPSKQ